MRQPPVHPGLDAGRRDPGSHSQLAPEYDRLLVAATLPEFILLHATPPGTSAGGP